MAKDAQHWRGSVLLWEEHGLFLGNAGRAEMHESPAIKICVSLNGAFGLSSPSAEFPAKYAAALIPAGVRHAIEGYGNRMAMLLIAPEGDLGQRILHLATADTIVDLGENLAGTLRLLLDEIGDDETSSGKLNEVIDEIADSFDLNDSQGIDPRVLQSIEWLRSGRESGFLVKDIAAEVDLSESRFSHIFSEHVRVPVRRYLLWLRLRDVLHLLASTGSLTEAAHSAGFSDSAHLSRTFRSALGIAPTDLIRESSLVSFLK